MQRGTHHSFLLAVLLGLGVASVQGLEIGVEDAGKTVSARDYLIRAEVRDSVPVRRVSVELNGTVVHVPEFEPQRRVELELPVKLELGRNLIGIRAETEQRRTSSLVTVTYDGGDDAHVPAVEVVAPGSGERIIPDSTIVVRGYAYDDVKVAEVNVEGRPTHPWVRQASRGGTKDLSRVTHTRFPSPYIMLVARYGLLTILNLSMTSPSRS